jgi:F-type H+-transporting ATPase subunit a
VKITFFKSTLCSIILAAVLSLTPNVAFSQHAHEGAKTEATSEKHEQPAVVHETPAAAEQHTTPATPGDHPATSAQATETGAEHTAAHDGGKFNPLEMIMHHISNSNEFHIVGEHEKSISVPLPCILWSRLDGFTTFMSSKLHHGQVAYNRYVMNHGVVARIKDMGTFPTGETEIEHIVTEKNGEVETSYAMYKGEKYELEKASNLLKMGSFIDFSISKNVFTMLLSLLLSMFIFFKVAKMYKTRAGQAPTGIQNLFEVIITFIIEEVAKPMLGEKYMKHLPFILSIFFFILFNNLIGLIPFFPGGANVTGNLSTTMALAVITFLLVNLNGNRDYWKHIFWMPGVPVPMKIFLAPIEFIGVFTKPVSLMIRLFANITAGHIIILSLVGLIFVFGNAGQNMAGASAGAIVAVPFTMFLNVIELIVAFIQAFIFAILSASYIGAATEEHHHDAH